MDYPSKRRYDKENTKLFAVKVNRKTEPEIFGKLETETNISGYIKRLIKSDLATKK